MQFQYPYCKYKVNKTKKLWSFPYGRSVILGLPRTECSAYHYKSIYSQTHALQPQSLQSAVKGRVAQYNTLVDNSGFGWQTVNSEPLDFNTEKLGHI